jgi:hypothetical protein
MSLEDAICISDEVQKEQTDGFAQQRIRPRWTYLVREKCPPVESLVFGPHRYRRKIDADCTHARIPTRRVTYGSPG